MVVAIDLFATVSIFGGTAVWVVFSQNELFGLVLRLMSRSLN